MKCHRCQREIPEGESFGYFGEVLCDDCYIDVMSPTKACDPWAVYTATRARESAGVTGANGLTPQQKEIYEFIKREGRVTAEDIQAKFNLAQRDLENLFATLRHCELARGQKEDGKIYVVPF
jgi:hypothetical protein